MKNTMQDSGVPMFLKRAESGQERISNEKFTNENFINRLMENPVKVDKSIPFLTRDEIYDRKL